jgi:hypothetical protein
MVAVVRARVEAARAAAVAPSAGTVAAPGKLILRLGLPEG